MSEGTVMFTGLIEDVGRIHTVEVSGSGATAAHRLTVATRLADETMPLGASLAVDGVCLTVTRWERGRVAVVAAPETLSLTTIGQLASGAAVNLERPLRVGDRLGGHLVAGHVDGMGRVAARVSRGEALDLRIACDGKLLRYIVPKGSIAIDGISLTVNTVEESSFTVSLITHTQGATTLGNKGVGASLNLEVDIIGKYVERLLGGHLPSRAGNGNNDRDSDGGVTLDKLKEHGFV